MSKVYRNAVDSILSIRKCYMQGLKALGSDSVYVNVSDTTQLNGSVFLDECTKNVDPDGNRWDYTFGYKDKSYYLEVHPAGTNEVDTIIKKFLWLKEWLRNDGVTLNAINAKEPFHWVASGKVGILPRSTYANRLTKAGLTIPKKRLLL